MIPLLLLFHQNAFNFLLLKFNVFLFKVAASIFFIFHLLFLLFVLIPLFLHYSILYSNLPCSIHGSSLILLFLNLNFSKLLNFLMNHLLLILAFYILMNHYHLLVIRLLIVLDILMNHYLSLILTILIIVPILIFHFLPYFFLLHILLFLNFLLLILFLNLLLLIQLLFFPHQNLNFKVLFLERMSSSQQINFFLSFQQFHLLPLLSNIFNSCQGNGIFLELL